MHSHFDISATNLNKQFNMQTLPSTFSQFLTQADSEYRKKLSSIPLFNTAKTATWDKNQKRLFAAIFYHLRGHFINFMWFIANFSADSLSKSIILDNINEEFGTGNRLSHEQLYASFAQEYGVDIHDEIVNETHYLPFAKQFNKGHLAWLAAHDAEAQIAAFAAYERLDNIDYIYLSECALSMNTSAQGMIFFKVHTHVEHFSSVIEKLEPIWEHTSDKIKQAFEFIYSHQIQMWQKLSDEIFALTKSSIQRGG